MKYISKIFIKRLVQDSDLVKIISSKISLKKIGKFYKACCPFHEDHNPSFIVNKELKYFYCFGCKISGNSIDFIMKYCHLNFVDSIYEIANILNISVEYTTENKRNFFCTISSFQNKYFIFMKRYNTLYTNTLLYQKNLSFVRKFLFKRGITLYWIMKFSIGFSYMPLVTKFINHYIKFHNINIWLKLGIVNKNQYNIICDRFINRIIFPIHDIHGNVVAFGGRVLYSSNNNKYINSMNNLYYHKKQYLYGLYYVIHKYNRLKQILVVEGYIDVIVLHTYGFNYTVGLLGTSVHDVQIQILFKYTNKIIFCYDGDKTGQLAIKASLRKILPYMTENKCSFFVFLPVDEDPDTLIRKEGKEKFLSRIEHARSIYEVLFMLYNIGVSYLPYQKKILLTSKLFTFISLIKSRIIKIFLKIELQNKLIHYYQKNFYNLQFIFSKKINKCLIQRQFHFFRSLIYLILINPYFSKYVNLDSYEGIYWHICILLFIDIVNICLKYKHVTSVLIIEKFHKKRIKCYLYKLFTHNFIFIENNQKLVFLEMLVKLKIFFINKQIDKIIMINKNRDLNSIEQKQLWSLLKIKNLSLHKYYYK